MDAYTANFELKSSKYLAIWIAGLHFLALFAMIISQLPDLLKIILILLIWVHFILEKRRYAKQKQPQILIYSEGLGWKLLMDQVAETIEIQPSTVITSFLIIIHYKIIFSENKIRSIVCFKDALNPKEFKKLSVQLKISGLSRKSSADNS